MLFNYQNNPMKNSYLFLLIAIFAACNNEQKSKDQNDTSAHHIDTLLSKSDHAVNLDTSDVAFFQKASYGGMVEVEASSKILTFTENAEIKSFAAMMVKDHGGVNKQLNELAINKGYILPGALPISKVGEIDRMNSFKDEARNEYYLQLMIAEHQIAIDVFAVASRSSDAAINKFATGLLPTLKHHYMEVKKLDSIFKLPKVSQGDDLLKISDREKQ